MSGRPGSQVLALCGGVGGAKLALGLYRVLGPDRLSVVVNTGDDFEHLGFAISPDLDTVLYTLGGVADPERGWGRANETWHFMEALRALGGESWFQLGDRDLAMHVERTAWLRGGKSLAAFAAHAAAKGVPGMHAITADGVRNNGFYRDCGFARAGTVLWNGKPIVFFARPLPAPANGVTS